MLLSLIALAATQPSYAATQPEPAPNAPRLLHQPAVHGDTIVFSYASDLWSWKMDGKTPAVRLTSGYGMKSNAFISPDGKTIAYDAYYDGGLSIYTIPITGGTPNRVTYDNTPDVVLGWTPEGKIAYADYNSNPHSGRQADLFEVDPSGSLPTPTPIHEISWASFYPSGDAMVYTRQVSQRFNWRRYRGGSQGVVSIYNFQNNSYSELPHGREQSYYPMVVGRDIYYVSDKGDGVLNLYRYQLQSKTVTKLTHFTGEDIKWANTDGNTIVFTQDGYLWVYDVKTGACHTVSPVIHTDQLLARPRQVSLGGSIDSFSLSPSGIRIAAAARGHIFSIPQHSGVTRDQTVDLTARDKMPEWSPDGGSIAYISDVSGETEIYSMPQTGLKAGDKPTQLTHLGQTLYGYGWSPDSSRMWVLTLDNTLYVLDVATKQLTKVGKPEYGVGSPVWSPDGRWIAYIEGKETNTTSVHMYEVASGKDTEITGSRYQNTALAFDDNGKYLYLISARSIHPTPGLFGPSLKIEHPYQVFVMTLAKDTADPLTPKEDEETPAAEGQDGPPPAAMRRMMRQGPPKGSGKKPGDGDDGAKAPAGPPPIKVDLAGLGDRIVPLPMPADDYQALYPSSNGVFVQDQRGLMKFSLSSRHASPVIMAPGAQFDFNPSHTMVAYSAGGVLGEIPAEGPPSNLGDGAIKTSAVEAVIDPVSEWKEIYWEAWRFMRDNYYDENFRGQNWKAIGDHFAAYLPWARSRTDVNVILGLLLSQLGTSHCYVEGAGDVGPMPTPVPVGYLGADFAISNGHVQFKTIYRGDSSDPIYTGPLGFPGMNVEAGDYLLAIDGQEVGTTNPAKMLTGKAGQEVSLTVNSKPTLDGARKVTVRPIGTEMNLRYEAWLDHERAIVDKLSNGRIGYMHIRDTSMQGSEDFARAFIPQTDKEALIVDERWNGGGYPDPKFVQALAYKTYSMGQSRIGGDNQITPSMVGPEAMLINGYAGSGGDLFPWTFRQAGLGPLIGTRTWGGLVGIGAGADLVDGGSISTPSFSVYDPKTLQIIAENHGIDPDIVVDDRPDLVAKGEDPQLMAAIDWLMKKLDKIGPPAKRTELPHVSKEGQRDLPPGIYDVKKKG